MKYANDIIAFSTEVVEKMLWFKLINLINKLK